MKNLLALTVTSIALGMAGCQTAGHAWPEPVAAADAPAQARTRGDATPIPWDRLEATALREPVLVTVDQATEVDFFRRRVWIDAGSTALLGTSPDTLYAACLAGRVAHGDDLRQTARPGRLLLWTPASDRPRVHAFDAARLQSSSPLVDAPQAQAALDDVRRRQARRLYWGNLQPTGVNAVASTPKDLNDQRAAYLQNADVVGLRFNPAEPASLARRVAESFVSLLQTGDGPRLARLMSPQLGVEGSASQPAFSRQTLADALAARDWSALENATLAQTDQPTVFRVDGSGTSYRLTLTPGDGLYYVTSIHRLPTLEAASR